MKHSGSNSGLEACAQLSSSLLQVISPFTLRFLIQFATDAYNAGKLGSAPPHLGVGLGLVFAVTTMQILQSLGTNQLIYRGMVVGGMTRASLISLHLRKVDGNLWPCKGRWCRIVGQRQGKGAESPWSCGEMVSAGAMEGSLILMSVDAYRVEQASSGFHLVWAAPISCLVTLSLLLVNLTYSALAGFALLVVGTPLLAKAINSLLKRRKKINKVTDQRVSLTQEILQSIRFIKLFGWEGAFLARLGDIRNREIAGIQMLLAIRNGIMAISTSLPIFASMLSFILYSLSNNSLAPAQVFSSSRSSIAYASR